MEESTFGGRTADFFYLHLFGAVMLLVRFPLLSVDLSQILNGVLKLRALFLGPSLHMMIVYIWARKSPFVRFERLVSPASHLSVWLSWVCSTLTHRICLGSSLGLKPCLTESVLKLQPLLTTIGIHLYQLVGYLRRPCIYIPGRYVCGNTRHSPFENPRLLVSST